MPLTMLNWLAMMKMLNERGLVGRAASTHPDVG